MKDVKRTMTAVNIIATREKGRICFVFVFVDACCFLLRRRKNPTSSSPHCIIIILLWLFPYTLYSIGIDVVLHILGWNLIGSALFSSSAVSYYMYLKLLSIIPSSVVVKNKEEEEPKRLVCCV